MRRWMLISAVVTLLVLSGCTPEPPPEAIPSVEPSTTTPTEPSEPSVEPTVEPIALPDCDSIYTPAKMSDLASGDSVPDAEGTVTSGSADDTVTDIFEGLDDTVSCGWYLPASESGSTTTIARIDDVVRAELEAAFAAGGFSVASTVDGDLYSIRVENEFITYEESHLLIDGFWIGTLYFGGSAEPLTLDAYAQLLS